MNSYENEKVKLQNNPATWVITGVGGFIGSNLLEGLLLLNQSVVGLENFSTGKRKNLEEVESLVSKEQWKRFRLFEGDICNPALCQEVCRNADYVLHHAAMGSVVQSIEDPVLNNEINVTGFLNMLMAARDQKVRRFIFAGSSAIYGDNPKLPKDENDMGQPLSPYAAAKYMNEFYSQVFARCYQLDFVGLRYFNVFGPRQDPYGAYAAVIPLWLSALIKGEQVFINGDGENTRDFCYVKNVFQANILAATTKSKDSINQIYNVALGCQTSLNELLNLLRLKLKNDHPHLNEYKAVYRDFRQGDIKHSHANITKAQKHLGFQPTHTLSDGLEEALDWYRRNLV